MNNSLLLLEIEQCRAEMISLSKEQDLSSKEVIRVSKQLDALLNKYRGIRNTFDEDDQTHRL